MEIFSEFAFQSLHKQNSNWPQLQFFLSENFKISSSTDFKGLCWEQQFILSYLKNETL